MHLLSLFTPVLLAALSRATVDPGTVTGNVNPVADPTLCRDDAGTYWLFSTAIGIDIRTSTDRINWSLIGTVWPDGASWTDEYTGTTNGQVYYRLAMNQKLTVLRNLWAPDCTYLNGEFWLYYAASSFGSQDSAIFLAKSSTGEPGSWTNEGLVTSTSSSDDYNAIDPNLFIGGSTWYLSLGSFWTGIKEQISSTGLLASSSITSLAERTADSGAIEASVIWQNGSYYYLFTSWDICCEGTNSTYNIRVGRSTSPTGDFVDESGVSLLDGGGTLVLGSHDYVIGPGGQDLMLDVDGVVMVYHYYTSAGTILGINLLDFSSGWPN
ncbi:hypothetical protein H0H92_006552 [Tricholoma furcatifolium]|nr:hypothetical protein H0H92_006552 [Tricholoma furcatifolium]